jgi:amino acid adenylation domain-containing protein
LTPLPIQYADFASWQREWLSGDVLERQLAYWKARLKNIAALQLPIDRRRPAVQTFSGARQVLELSGTLRDRLVSLSRAEGATFFMTMLSAFVVLLRRYTGQDDIVVGSPIANRNRSEIEGLIGCFVNSLVMRVDVSGDPNFRTLLGRVRGVALGAYEHQDLPFEKLVEELGPERDMSRNPLFQVTFGVINVPMEVSNLGDLRLEWLRLNLQEARFDLEVYLFEGSADRNLQVIYNTDLFDAATIDRMLDHYERILESVVANPGQPISNLDLLGPDERRRIVVEWNDTATDYPRESCIHELFEAQARRAPDAVAVVYGEDALTYRCLNERANRLAHYLRARGVGPGVMVGICIERSLEMVVGLLAVLKAGGAYVPLDPEYPKARLAFMLEDAEPPVLLTQRRLLGNLPVHGAQVTCLDEFDWSGADMSLQDPNAVVDSDNLAYVIYTSGSTGEPKGALNTHRALVNHMVWMQTTFGFTADDKVLQKTPFSFDASVWEFYAPLLIGGQLVMARPGGHQDSGYLVETINDHGITILQAVPSLLQLLLADRIDTCVTLRRVFCGGEELSNELTQRFFDASDAALINLYGVSEACIDSIFHACTRTGSAHTIPIGRPIANTRVYILDEHKRPVPVGVPGELYLGGEGLARGYLKRSELTAEQFVPDAFHDEPESRMYRTGDRARYFPDGNIEFLGRVDTQIKLRGHRIELGEIEAVLAEHPAVRETVVVAREEGPGDKRLVAYLVRDGRLSDGDPDLREFLRHKLPDYMVPSVYIDLKALPLTPNGKLDRRALPAPTGEERALSGVFVAPRGEMEERIAAIWRDVLGTREVGVRDNFFDLGGHSLLATQVTTRLRSDLRVDIPLDEIFWRPTVAELANLAEALQDGVAVRTTKGRERGEL